MTQEQFAEIQARASACEPYYMSPLGEQVITQDVPALTEEVVRLEAENTALRTELTALREQLARRDWVLKRTEEILAFEHGKSASYSIDQAWLELPPMLTAQPTDQETP